MTRRLDLLSPPVPTWQHVQEAPDTAGTVITLVPGFDAGSIEQTASAAALAVGTGDGSQADLTKAGAAVGARTRHDPLVTHLAGAHGPEADLTAYVEAVSLARWRSPRWDAQGPTTELQRSTHVLVGSAPIDLDRAVVRTRSALLARTLATTPSNIKNPAWLARQAVTMARSAGLTSTVWTERSLATEGFGGLLAVGGGSATGPRLVQLDWRPVGTPKRGAEPVVLVGKGITFDTGGLDLKTADGMLAMKTDMSGAAIVLAVLTACQELAVPFPVTGLLPLAENAISGAAYRPSDVITQYGGTTVEIGNTDAEGRIVLADALAYAATRLAPRAIIDIATLTGAARIALSRSVAPVFGTSDPLVDALIAAGETTGETLWRMPLPTAYRADLSSEVADLAHVVPGGVAGAVYAALFLREFVGEVPWAHLDIAGPGRSDDDAGIFAKGATGFGTRLLLRYLEGMS